MAKVVLKTAGLIAYNKEPRNKPLSIGSSDFYNGAKTMGKEVFSINDARKTGYPREK